MKTTFLTIILLVLAIICNAKVLTVSNDPNQPAMYTSFSDAYNVACIGDTLYVIGSQTSYGSVTITKGITIIGSGFNDPNERKFETTFGDITLTYKTGEYNEIVSNCSGTTIEGIECNNIQMITSELTKLQNLKFQNCELVRIFLSNGDNILIKNCIVSYAIYAEGLSTAYVENLTISNNFIGYLRALKSKKSTTVISNNLIFWGSGTCLDNIEGANIFNNINCNDGTYYRLKNCVFSKNISVATQALNVFDADNNIIGDNNLINTDPQFKNVPQTKIDLTYDYRLKDTSPGKNAGTDGKDIGITGGDYPWPLNAGGMLDFRGRPSLPYIEKMQILNSVVPTNGTINVSITAKSQN
jgi:hypothetical protein